MRRLPGGVMPGSDAGYFLAFFSVGCSGAVTGLLPPLAPLLFFLELPFLAGFLSPTGNHLLPL